MAQLALAQLALDDNERYAFVSHLDSVGVLELVGRETTPHACRGGRVMWLLARGGGFPAATRGRSMQHAEHRPDRKVSSDLKSRA